MREFRISILLCASAVMLTGCASSLTVKDADNKALPGIPIRTPSAFVVSGKLLAHTTNVACQPTSFRRLQAISDGPVAFLNVKSSWFSKAGLTVKMGDNGATEIVFNTEPVPDALRAAMSAATTAAPYLGIFPVDRSAQGTDRSGSNTGISTATAILVPCNTSDLIEKVVPLKDWKPD
ncbi:MAG: hypothetical protein ACK5SF_09925 [Hyphomonadaceae bacterium]|jgi:hypothetical protein|nr:hypothetical protein [Aquidulcibacter sp.]